MELPAYYVSIIPAHFTVRFSDERFQTVSTDKQPIFPKGKYILTLLR